MKVILNKDISPLGEEGDVKEVARGYARNFLFPRRFALPYTERTIRVFEARKDEIAERKKQKRTDAESVKERLEALELSIIMPAGANGKLYGAVTSQSIMDELTKLGFQIERKRIEIPGNSIKSTGKHKFTVRLYGNTTAEMYVSIAAQEVKTQSKEAPAKEKRRRSAESRSANTAEDSGGGIPSGESEAAQAETGDTGISPPVQGEAAAALPVVEPVSGESATAE
ncbi:MAG: 50S ribosomal protein L9 [Spirochaetaceae bacterium]|nr:50S ribosomal protein L9 [Spirochaetaceae bacterium]